MAEAAELPEVEGMARPSRGGAPYAAFISYKHGVEDTRWASRLLVLLETYKVPKALQRQGYPSRLGKVFRDVEELTAASDLDEGIKSALERSNNLIVICSPQTPGSRWVGQEIAYFKALGKGGRIFPVLIGGREDEAFHPQLLTRQVRETAEDGTTELREVPIEPLAVDLRPSAHPKPKVREKRALLQLAAAILDVGYDDLERREANRKRKRQFWIAAPLVALALVIAGAAYQVYDSTFAVKTRFCANYGERFGEPFCIGPVAQNAQGARSMSYKLVSQAGHVREMTRVNGLGLPLGEPDNAFEGEDWNAGAATFHYLYDEDGALASVTQRDVTGRHLRTALWSFDSNRGTGIVRFEDGKGMADRLRINPASLATYDVEATNRSNVGQYLLRFNLDGLVLNRTYHAVGGGAVPDGRGIYGRAYTYGSGGILSEVRDLDAGGNPLLSSTGSAALRFTYDQNGDLARLSWVDEVGAPALGPLGVAAVRYERVGGNVVRSDYLGLEGTLVLLRDTRFASILWGRDSSGNIIERTNLGEDGLPTSSADLGYARMLVVRDARGNAIRERYFDPEGNPAPLLDRGYTELRSTYDDVGRLTGEGYFGPNEQSIASLQSGVAAITHRYGQEGLIAETRFTAPDGALAPHNLFGAAFLRFNYDARGNLIETRLFGTDGELVGGRATGAAIERITINRQGNRETISFFDTFDRPMLTEDHGIYSIHYTYEENGRVASEGYFGTDGAPILHRSLGIAGFEWSYGQVGKMTREVSVGASGEPLARSDTGVARSEWDYDLRGNITELHYFDASGAPKVDPISGASGFRFGYDAYGRTIDVQYFGPDGSKLRRVKSAYDARGNLAYIGFFGADDQPIAAAPGFHALRRVYDQRDQLLEERYYSIRGWPCANVDGISVVHYRRDGTAGLFDLLGRPIPF